MQFTISGLLYLVGSSWTSCANISATDDRPVLSRPSLVSAVSVYSIKIQIKCQHIHLFSTKLNRISITECSHLLHRTWPHPHPQQLEGHWVSETSAHQNSAPGYKMRSCTFILISNNHTSVSTEEWICRNWIIPNACYVKREKIIPSYRSREASLHAS